MTTEHETPLEDRLRHTLATAADAQPVVDDWTGVLARETSAPIDADPGRRPSNRRRHLLVAAGVVVLIGVAAVVGVVVQRDGDEQVRTVNMAEVAEASKATTARVAVTQELPGGVTLRSEGELDFARRRARFTGDLGQPAESAAPGGLDGAPAEIREQFEEILDVTSSATELIAIGDETYLFSKGQWWAVGAGDGASETGLDLLSPDTVLDQIAELGDVQAIGTGQVRGVDATHYRAEARDGGTVYDIWVDDQDQAVRIAATVPTGSETVRVTMDLFDFGRPVDIQAPANAEPLVTAPSVDADLAEVASGREGEVSWSLSTGSLADGRRCVQVQTDPALDGEVVLIDPDAMGATSSEVPAGAETPPSCGPASSAELGGSGAVLLAVGGRRGDVHYLAGLLDEGAEVTVRFADGQTERLEGHDGAFVLPFSGDNWPVSISGADTTCGLPGTSSLSGSDSIC